MRLTVVGCGYVGLVTGTCFAEMGNHVLAVEKDPKRIDMLRGGEMPIYEPGLAELVVRNSVEGRLEFTSDLLAGIAHGEMIFICVGTPPLEDGSSDLSAVNEVARAVAEHAEAPKVLIVKSTVPAGTCRHLAEELAAVSKVPIDVASNPEFLKEGAALDDFFRPDRIVVGSESERALRMLRYLYSPFLRTGRPFITMNTASAELTKHASNAMLASRISFINEVAALCERVGADVEEVRRGMASDQRIGQRFLFPGLGFGGSCFPKDLLSLAHVGRQTGSPMPICEAATEVNAAARARFLERIMEHFGGNPDGRVLAFWGLAFKPRTDDVREAPAVWLIREILSRSRNVVIRAHDPMAMERAAAILGDGIEYSKNDYEMLNGADALVISTEWNEFRSPDFARMKELMAAPVIFDGRNIYEPEMMRELGFTYYSVGRPTVTR